MSDEKEPMTTTSTAPSETPADAPQAEPATSTPEITPNEPSNDSATTSSTDDTSHSTPNNFDTPSARTTPAATGQEPVADIPPKKRGEIKLDVASLRAFGHAAGRKIVRYASLLFFLLVAAVYGFVVIRINMLSNIQPNQSDIDAQTTSTPIPRIDPNIAKRLENLKDNSQNVQTLFDEARQNPFD